MPGRRTKKRRRTAEDVKTMSQGYSGLGPRSLRLPYCISVYTTEITLRVETLRPAKSSVDRGACGGINTCFLKRFLGLPWWRSG